MRLIQLHDMTAALQAKVISRLFEPERLVWKDFDTSHFSRSPAWLQSHPHVPQRMVDLLGYGPRIILTTRRLRDLGIQSKRIRAYTQAYRRLKPHRLVQPSSLTAAQIAAEPLFHNAQITEGGKPLLPTAVLLAAAQQGITAVGDLSSGAPNIGPVALLRLQQALPEPWRAFQQMHQPAAGWFNLLGFRVRWRLHHTQRAGRAGRGSSDGTAAVRLHGLQVRPRRPLKSDGQLPVPASACIEACAGHILGPSQDLEAGKAPSSQQGGTVPHWAPNRLSRRPFSVGYRVTAVPPAGGQGSSHQIDSPGRIQPGDSTQPPGTHSACHLGRRRKKSHFLGGQVDRQALHSGRRGTTRTATSSPHQVSSPST